MTDEVDEMSMTDMPKAIWIAGTGALCHCTALRDRKLVRRLHKKRGSPWVTFYDAKTKRRVWDCNSVFAKIHFYRQRG